MSRSVSCDHFYLSVGSVFPHSVQK